MARRHTYRARPSLREGCRMIASIVILGATALCRGADARGQLGRSLDARLSLEATDATRRQGGALGTADSRRLLEADSEELGVVTQPQQLHDAIAKGIAHIEITAHLDLTTLPLLKNTGCKEGCDSALPDISIFTKSIRGNCQGDPPTDEELEALTGTPGAVGLLPFQKGQCLIIVNEDIFRTMGHRLWLDNLYMRVGHYRLDNLREYAYISLASFEELPWPLRDQGRRYVTRTTFQGDGAGPGVGIWAKENTYIENCTFANLGGDGFSDACDICTGAVIANANAAVHIVNSTFFDPVRLPGTTYVRTWDTARVQISGCQFAQPPDVSEPLLYAANNATVFSDDPIPSIRDADNNVVEALPVSAIPEYPENSDEGFPLRSDPWFKYQRNAQGLNLVPAVAQVAPTTPVALLDIELSDTPGPADTIDEPLEGTPARIAAHASDGGDSYVSGGPIAAIILGVLLLIFVLLALLLCVLLRRAWARNGERSADQKPLDGFAVAKAGGPGDPKTTPMRVATSPALLPWDKPDSQPAPDTGVRALPQQPSYSQSRPSVPSAAADTWTGAEATLGSLTADDHSTQGTHSSPLDFGVAAISPGAPINERIAHVHQQLSSIGNKVVLLNRFKLAGRDERCNGDQSVVAFATGADDGHTYALKFFMSRAAFKAEVAMRLSGALATTLPQVHAVHDPNKPDDDPTNAAGVCTDIAGQPLPPCIVFARGQSLPQWRRRAQPDVFHAVTVLSHIATNLRDIHAANYVHGDVKPEHILLLRRENRWTVIDYDKAAVSGTLVTLDYTLEYAAPEVVAASYADTTVTMQPSLDSWALGVIAYELLTGDKALDTATDGKESVIAQLRGFQKLPWEDGRITEGTLRQLGVFREPVLGLLRRDSAQRATPQDLCTVCEQVVMSQTTTADV